MASSNLQDSHPQNLRNAKGRRYCQGGKPALALRSFGDRIIGAAREGDHFDVWEHAMFDIDRRDVAAVIGADE